MNSPASLLGRYGEDRVTGFRGRITAVVEYLSGCVQVCLTPKVGTDGKLPDGSFFDVQRIKIDETVVRMTLDNGAQPGFDLPPPSRNSL